ncbi:GtrA family protein [Brachybacterium sp. NPDC056505]|uniref:GtrA family protein n=1 Tax=Brachybacterium sp. NPDC056505 TaxID=3345843 RepID=UPI00366D632E
MAAERATSLRALVGRFLVSGGAMALLDLCLYSGGTLLVHWPPIAAHVVSTLITICVSFAVNRAFVFRAHGTGVRAFVPFLAVTLVTALVIQTLIITGVVHACGVLFPQAPEGVVAIAAKIIAVGVAAVCNFVSYRVIFSRTGSARV